MESIDPYKECAAKHSEAEFEARYPHPFLVKRPKLDSTPSAAAPQFGFHTAQASVAHDPMRKVWQVVPVVKKPGNPFPDRLTIGRTPNCDVVLRLPFISKVHAHLLVQPGGTFVLKDNNASNQTRHQNRPLSPGGSCVIEDGDIVSFGSLDLELMSPGRFYRTLRFVLTPESGAQPNA